MQKRLTYILDHEELSDNIKKNLDVLRNALTETQDALWKAHSDPENDGNAVADQQSL